MIKISVSSLPYNDNIIENIKQIIDSGADFLHLDIMDGSLTEKITFNEEKVKEINSKTTLFLDCHLMVNEPKEIVKKYIKAGVNIITIHFEAFKNKSDLVETLKFLKEKNVISGLAIYPSTKIDDILYLKDYFDLLLIMSVEIGKYGQTFIESSIDKIKQAKRLLPNKLIEVDGGINLENIQKIREAGADIIVVGGAYFKSENKQEFITQLKK